MKTFYFILALVCFNTFAQEKDLNLSKYPKKIRNKVASMLEQNQTIDEAFKLSVNEDTDVSNFNFHTMSIKIEAPLETVWRTYTETDLRKLYATKKVNFVLAYNRVTNEIYEKDYNGDLLGIEGVGLFVQLVFLEGAMKMVTATEITKVDHEKKQIEFTYFEDGASRGRQYVSFKEINGSTIITHDSRFLCYKKSRNKLYPYFHEMALSNFHENIGTILNVKAKWLK